MKNNNIDAEKFYKDTKKKLIWEPFGRFLSKFDKRGQTILMIILVVLGIFVGVSLFLFGDFIKQKINSVLGVNTDETIVTKSQDYPGNTNLAESNLEKDRVENKCRGAQFDIYSEDYFERVGNERFFEEEIGVSAKETEYFQASNKSKWACKIPFIAQVVAIPLSGQSFGLFFEYEDVFRVLVGDGDRVTLKVEQNKLDDRKRKWQPVPDKYNKERQKLKNPIEDGEEVTLIVKAKESEGNIVLHIDVYHSKYQSVEKFDYVFSPNAINIQAPQQRNFRIGLNDFRFEGTGSIIDLKTLSVEEKEW